MSVLSEEHPASFLCRDHGNVAGQEFSILNESFINGVLLQGEYTVASVLNSYSFTFNGSGSATSSGSQFQGPDIINAGVGDGVNVTLTLSLPDKSSPLLNITSATWAANVATLYYTTSYQFVVGASIVVNGMTPSAMNGSFVVTAIGYSAPNYYVRYALTGSGTATVFGTVQNALYNIGSHIVVTGITFPSAWNGYYSVVSVTDTTVTYANTTVGDYLGGGAISTNGGTVDYVY